ncbi:CIB1 (predicted) [Pycnogonum litorale]
MGATHSHLTDEEIQDYKDLTYFTTQEILNIFKKFRNISPKDIDNDPHARLPWSKVTTIPELQRNPFADRLCLVFSSKRDGHLSFEDFLDMVHVLSDNVPVRTKAAYAFAVYDFDDDGVISPDDLKILINRLIGDDQDLSETFTTLLIDSIMEEVGLDEDGVLQLIEFERVALKSPDFIKSFRMRI